MTDNFDPDRMFEALRDSTRRAPVASAADVRKRGHQRAVRARVLYSTTAFVVLAGGAGVAYATGQNTADRHLEPGERTPSATVTTAPTTPSRAPRTTTPVPTSAPSVISTTIGGGGSVVAGPGTTASSPATTTSTTRPVVHPTTPHTTPPTTPTTTTPAAPTTTPAAQTPSLSIDVVRTPANATTFTVRVTFTGLLPQPYDFTTNKPLTGATDPLGGFSATLDGKVTQIGGDGGEVQCHAGAALVHASGTSQSVPMTVTPGHHVLTVQVRSACGGLHTVKSFPFTVS